MTKEEFFAHKAQTIRTMDYMLELSRTHNKPLTEYAKEYDKKRIIIKRDADEDELRETMLDIAIMMDKPKTVMSMRGETKQSGRYDYFNYIEYSFKTLVVKHEIEAYQVEDMMKLWVKQKLGLNSYDYLECQVMQLFKDGTIEWEDVIKAHKGACKL